MISYKKNLKWNFYPTIKKNIMKKRRKTKNYTNLLLKFYMKYLNADIKEFLSENGMQDIKLISI